MRDARLDLGQVAPDLASLPGGTIPMPPDDLAGGPLPPSPLGDSPADSSAGGGWLTIAAVSSRALALPTKTRPKRLVLLASDGAPHAFLLKGRDDLRVDERVMQFMRAADAVTAKSSAAGGDAGGDAQPLAARRYSVTPLGPRAGLVQWVRGTVSLFGLFRAWQASAAARAGAVAAARRGADGASGGGGGGVPRGAPRKDWPRPVLRGALLALSREAPRHLLARELWASAGSAAAWWARRRRCCESAAAASALGWVLGIGDRHLDNILLDRAGGGLAHIDFSVCLDKGAALRVPEVVPFRLTPMLQARGWGWAALGPTGKEGAFRAALERALAALRRAAGPLGGLLALLLQDPGVDW
ncbi:MAG: kinase-like domain-containing protein, partial [Monoraphidium minutum]